MGKKEKWNRELKLTAALYATRANVLETVKKTGRLPEEIHTGGMQIGMRLLIESRGTDITLTEDEQLVYDAMMKGGRLPGGKVVLVDKEEK